MDRSGDLETEQRSQERPPCAGTITEPSRKKTGAEVVGWVGWGQTKISSGRNSITKNTKKEIGRDFCYYRLPY